MVELLRFLWIYSSFGACEEFSEFEVALCDLWWEIHWRCGFHGFLHNFRVCGCVICFLALFFCLYFAFGCVIINAQIYEFPT